METIIIKGLDASGVIPAPSGLGVVIKSIQATNDLNITFSGLYSGSLSIKSNAYDINKRFNVNENVNINTQSFAATDSAIISYIYVGNQEPYMQSRFRMVMPTSFRR